MIGTRHAASRRPARRRRRTLRTRANSGQRCMGESDAVQGLDRQRRDRAPAHHRPRGALGAHRRRRVPRHGGAPRTRHIEQRFGECPLRAAHRPRTRRLLARLSRRTLRSAEPYRRPCAHPVVRPRHERPDVRHGAADGDLGARPGHLRPAARPSNQHRPDQEHRRSRPTCDSPHLRARFWEWGEPETADRVEGSAVEFCHVVTQGRNIADTDLAVAGETASRWMAVAQCFAGGPEEPPAAGQRHWG